MSTTARASWVREMVRLKAAPFPVGHSIRSAITVGVPFVIGAVTGDMLQWMWVGLATLLLAAGERSGSHRLNVRILMISTPIAAAAYLLGFLQDLPLWALIPIMTVLAWGAGIIAGWGAAFSVGGMQFLLVAAIALGVSTYKTWWQPIVWYAVGAAFYLALMLIEFALYRGRPERAVLLDLIDALDGLVGARLASVTKKDDADSGVSAARRRAVAALTAARSLLKDSPVGTKRQRARTRRLSQSIESAESLQAMVLAEDDPQTLTAVRDELNALRKGTTRTAPPSALSTKRAREFALAVGDLRVGLGTAGERPPERTPLLADRSRRPLHERVRVGREVRAAAVRLAICTGIAYGAKTYLPIEHWFWVPLTIALVMKPDFGSVFGRAVLRVVGTVVGAALAAVAIWLVHPRLGLAVVIAVFAFFVPWFMMKSYALQAVAIAPAVILLVYSLAPQPSDTLAISGQRILATVVGGVIVIVFGYLLWPSARRVDIPRALTDAVTSLTTFIDRAATPIPTDPAARTSRHDDLVAARRHTYATLSNLRTHLRRGLTEPPPADEQAQEWLPAVSAVEHLTDAVSAYSVRRLEGQPVPDAGGLADEAKSLAAATTPDGLIQRCGELAQRVTG